MRANPAARILAGTSFLCIVLLLVAQGWAQTTQPAKKAAPTAKQDDPVAKPKAQPASKPEDENDPQAVATIDRFVKALGGTEMLSAIHDRTVRFLNRKFEPSAVTEVKMARFLKGAYKIREEWALPGMGLTKPGEPLRFLQTYNGEKGYVRSLGYVSELEGRTLNILVWDKYLDHFFMHWKEDGYSVQYRGEQDVDGENCHWVTTRNYTGTQKVHYFFRSDDDLLVKKQWRTTGLTGSVMKEQVYDVYTKIRHSDYRDKWLMLATNVKTFEEGELSLEMDFTEVKLNSGLEDSLFERPDGPDFSVLQEKKDKERREKAKAKATSQAKSQPKRATSNPTSKPK